MICFELLRTKLTGRSVRIAASVLGLLLLTALAVKPAFAQVLYWDPGVGMPAPLPALYYFKPDGTGARTTYPTGRLEFGQTFPFAYKADQNNVLRIQFASGYTDVFQILSYDQQADTLILRGYGQSARARDWPWYGCRSGQVPVLIATALCQGR